MPFNAGALQRVYVGHGAVYTNPDKTMVLQEVIRLVSDVRLQARTFNESPLNPRKCVQILTKILVVIGKGEKLGKTEATEAFFAMTKLFQSNDQNLRRMVYLVIKELSTVADDVIIVTSSLTKDMTGSEAAFRGPAIRALCTITDASMVQSIERYLKQAVVDKSPAIASAVLTSAIKLMRVCPDIIRRWVNEVQEAANSSRVMVQYHALGLLYLIRKTDRLAVTKMIQKFTRSTLRSPYAYCVMATKVIWTFLSHSLGKLLLYFVSRPEYTEHLRSYYFRLFLCDRNNAGLFEFLESSLRHKSEMVIYEAARAIINLRGATARELAPAVSVLQLLCSSPKPALRYAAVRTLNTVATNHPSAVTACNLDLEQLIGDSNRSIATLAITTLLKTGNENNVERLLKHVCPFMSEITDEFKIVVLESIRALAAKYPKKFSVLLNFLSGLLRDSAGYVFKKAVVSVIESIIKDIPEAKNLGLLQLCEFIEDCEHVKLTQRILHLLGREGPFLKRPRQFIRFIYNRVILESAPVKCTATTALARFGAQNAELLPSILVLLQRIMLDEDDEVRDRAAFYYHLLSSKDPSLKSAYLLADEMHLSPSGLERALLDYTHDSHAAANGPFSLATVPIASPVQPSTVPLADGTRPERTHGKALKGTGDYSVGDTRATASSTARLPEIYAEQLAAVPQLAGLGPIFKSSKPVELSEEDTEYAVRCVKHIFAKHLVLQYECTNTMQDQLLEDVRVEVEPEDSGFIVLRTVPCPTLSFNIPGNTYVLVQLPDSPEVHSTTFTNTMKFTVRDPDTDGGEVGLPDEYQLEDLSIEISDHIQKVLKGNFSLVWQELKPESEVEETYMLARHKTIKDAMLQVIDHLGLQPCDRTDQMTQEQKSSHQLLLSGVFRGGIEVLAICKFARVVPDAGTHPISGQGISLLITVRSSNQEISQVIADCIG
ncbi:coatomer gamma subunit appendage domain protein [Opisthorchis viverrini]|uniref:Coatomer subunit gamma n=1 Tax=Opisthorchis viverrini TaxID=6198 RepID=A0A1S8WVL6_OPIVI|nr:coatomer gamma subunit appendage domain protein [Opisthorchis viverrini]